MQRFRSLGDFDLGVQRLLHCSASVFGAGELLKLICKVFDFIVSD